MLALIKHVRYGYLLLVFFLVAASQICQAQKDSVKHFIPQDSLAKAATPVVKLNKVDSVLKFHSPKKAAIRSAIIPGLGQIYNKKYWKLPIVYGALGTAAGIFFYNIQYYKKFRFAYAAKIEAALPMPDSTKYRQLSADMLIFDVSSLRLYRDEFRQNIDYSVLAFIVLWGLNVVDAAVDAHLKSFDVSPDLSLRFNIGHSIMANTNGISLVLSFKK